MIRDCRAWAIIADAIPDISKHEQLSLGTRIVSKDGSVQSIFYYAQELHPEQFKHNILKSLRLVAQRYDEASNISGQYNRLQNNIQKNIGEHVIFNHCYAHALNLLLPVLRLLQYRFPNFLKV